MMDMSISRRSFIGGTMIIPAAALMAASPGVTEASAGDPVTHLAEPNWKWWAGDGEHFSESFDTFEQAMKFAQSEGCREVVRAHQDVLHCPFEFSDSDVYRVMEDAEDGTNEPGLTEDGDAFEGVGDDDIQDLVDRLNAASEAWFQERGIRNKLNVYYFQGITDRTTVDLPDPKEEAA